MEFINKLKGFLFKPSKSFTAEEKSTVSSALKYGLIGLIILAILNAIIATVFSSVLPLPLPFEGATGGIMAAISFFATLFFGFIGIIIMGLWLHLWVYIFGGRGIGNTLKTVFYAYSPVYVLGWIPIINFLANIWYLVLAIIGLTKLQGLSTPRAIGAVVIAIIIPVIIIIALILWAVSLVGPEVLAAMGQMSPMS